MDGLDQSLLSQWKQLLMAHSHTALLVFFYLPEVTNAYTYQLSRPFKTVCLSRTRSGVILPQWNGKKRKKTAIDRIFSSTEESRLCTTV